MESHRHWVEEFLKSASSNRDAKWSESIAVGDKGFVSEIKSKLGVKAIGRKVYEDKENCELRECQTPYKPLFAIKKSPLSFENSFLWDINYGRTIN